NDARTGNAAGAGPLLVVSPGSPKTNANPRFAVIEPTEMPRETFPGSSRARRPGGPAADRRSARRSGRVPPESPPSQSSFFAFPPSSLVAAPGANVTGRNAFLQNHLIDCCRRSGQDVESPGAPVTLPSVSPLGDVFFRPFLFRRSRHESASVETPPKPALHFPPATGSPREPGLSQHRRHLHPPHPADPRRPRGQHRHDLRQR